MMSMYIGTVIKLQRSSILQHIIKHTPKLKILVCDLESYSAINHRFHPPLSDQQSIESFRITDSS